MANPTGIQPVARQDTVESPLVEQFCLKHRASLELIRRSRHFTYIFLKKLIASARTTTARTLELRLPRVSFHFKIAWIGLTTVFLSDH